MEGRVRKYQSRGGIVGQFGGAKKKNVDKIRGEVGGKEDPVATTAQDGAGVLGRKVWKKKIPSQGRSSGISQDRGNL